MTQINSSQTIEKAPTNTGTWYRFWGTIGLNGLLFLVSTYYSIAVYKQISTLAGAIAFVFFTLGALVAAVDTLLAFLRRMELGLKLSFYYVLLFPIAAAALIIGRTLTASATVLVLAFITIMWLLPRSERRWHSVSTAGMLIVATILEWINLPWRIPFGAVELGPAATAIFGLVLGGLIISQAIRQAMKGNLRIKLIVMLVSVTVVSIAIVGFMAYYLAITSINTQVGSNLSEISKQLASKVAEHLNTNIQILGTLGLDKVLQNNVATSNTLGNGDLAEINRLDQLWKNAPDNDPLINSVVKNELADDLREFKAKFPEYVEVFTTDKYGRITASTNRTSDYYQADEDWWQAAWDNGKGKTYISQVSFDESSNTYSLIIAIPVTAHNAQTPIGVLRASIDVNEFSTLIQSFKLGETGRSDLIFQDNRTLTAETGFDKLSPEDIVSVGTLPGTYGQITYEKSPTLASIGLITAPLSQYKSSIEQLNWRVIVHQDISEAQAGAAAITRGILLIAIVLIIIATAIAIYFAQVLSSPIVRLTQTAEKIASGDIDIQAKVETTDEIGTLAGAFNNMTDQLRESIASLETRVADRTQSLELANQVGRAISQVDELNVMLQAAVETIRSRFYMYYVQVYLVDPSSTNLILRSGTGEEGVQLVSRGHSLPINTNSINGRAAFEKSSVVVVDTTQSSTFKPNPLLPLTQSEMAIPLMIGEKVIGVLDLQSEQAGALNNETVSAFEALAGQLAIAIQNANLLDEANQARAEVEKQAQRLARASWKDYLDAIHKPEKSGYVFTQNQIIPFSEGEAAQWPEGLPNLAAPIAVSGEQLGELIVGLELQKQSPEVTELVNIVARQVSQQLENLRLLESANRYRAEVEQVSRLATVEGWKKYVEERAADSLSYLYDLKEVKPYNRENEQEIEEQAATLPLKVRDETIGKIAITGINPDDTEALSLANDVAERLSAHIESIRQFEETKRGQVELDQRARQLASVAEVSTVSSRELNIQKMLESVVTLTQSRFDLYHAHIFTYDKNTDNMVIQACGWKEGDGHEGTHGTTAIALTQEQSLVARSGRTLEAVIVNDVRNEPGWLPNPMLPDTLSEMAVPLVIGGQLLGVLDVQSDHLNAFTAEDASIYTTLASQVATALQNAQSFARAQQQAEREAKLNLISQKIQGATTVEAVLQIAARELGHALGAPRTIAQLSLKDKQ